MDENHKDSSNKIVLEKEKGKIISNLKIKKPIFSFVKKLLNIFSSFCNIFLSLRNKIKSCSSKCSILVQFPINLIPISIIMTIFIFMIHAYFYSYLYIYNFSKAFKDEFLDLYITKIEDLKSELTTIDVKETKINIEDQLFFQVYFKELALAGILNQTKKFFPSFSDNPGSTSLYSRLNNIKKTNANFEIREDLAKRLIDRKENYKLVNFLKIYYYMFPHIWYSSLVTKTLINQSFFIPYEIIDDREQDIETGEHFNIKGISYDYFFYFLFPKLDSEISTNNFATYDYLLNPSAESWETFNFHYLEDNFYYGNWFLDVDFDFRASTNNTEYDLLTNISFAHINKENDGDINKFFVTYSQQYIRQDNKDYIVNIVFIWNQISLRDENNDYTILIIKDNFTESLGDGNLTIRYSDNESYVVSISDTAEYTFSDIDFKFYHLNFYYKTHSLYNNGILMDCFHLDYFYNYSIIYSIVKKVDYDTKFYVTLYLYKSLFQNVEYTKVQRNKDQIFLYSFKKSDKIKQICEKIDFSSYKNYLFDSARIDCFNERTKKYYNKEKFIYTSLTNDTKTIDPIYPYCFCLPLYCLKNYENLDENLDNLEFVDEINLPNKCQNKFLMKENTTLNVEYSGNKKINDLIDISSNAIDYNHVKFIYMGLNQIPGYFLFVISQIKSTGEVYIHIYYKLITKIEITILVLIILFITSIISIIIIYMNMKKYSLIISHFKKQFEFYVFHSENEEESNSNKNNNNNDLNKNIKIKKYIKDEQSINFNNNDNALLDDLFLIFSQTYNVYRKDIEKLYSLKKYKSKNQVKLHIMKEKNELFKLLSFFCLYAPFFKLNLNFDYNMYEYSIIIKKYNNYIGQLENIDKKQIRLTKNILIELISAECMEDYGLITNFKFGYVKNIEADSKEYSIKYTMYENIKNDKNQKLKKLKVDNDIKNEQTKKLVLKGKNLLLDIFRNYFEADDYVNYNKLNIAFNFFLINSYYKYSKQIAQENISS